MDHAREATYQTLSLLLCYSVLYTSVRFLIHPHDPCSHPATSASFSAGKLIASGPAHTQVSYAFCPVEGRSQTSPGARAVALAWVGSVGGTGWGGSLLGSPLGKGGFLEGPWPSSGGGGTLTKCTLACYCSSPLCPILQASVHADESKQEQGGHANSKQEVKCHDKAMSCPLQTNTSHLYRSLQQTELRFES